MALGRMTVGAQGNVTPPFENVIKAAQRSEQQGYDIIWWYDHLMSWWPQSIWTPDLAPPAKLGPSPHVHLDALSIIAAAGPQTERAMLGTSVTDALRRPPAVLAQELLTLDHITKGRVILGIGAGETCNCAPYGVEFSKPVSHLQEALKIIRLLWESKEPVDYDGQFWKLHGAIISLPPYRPGRFPPIWVGGTAPRTLQIVGQHADGWLPMLMPLGDYIRSVQTIRSTATAAGRDPDAITCGTWGYVVVDENHEECHRMLDAPLIKDLCLALPAQNFQKHGRAHPLGENAFGLADYIPSLSPRERVLELIDKVPFEVVHDFVYHGTPRDIADHFAPYVAAGLRHVGFQNVTFGADDSKLAGSFKLLNEAKNYLKELA